jgi:hypothetical protein
VRLNLVSLVHLLAVAAGTKVLQVVAASGADLAVATNNSKVAAAVKSISPTFVPLFQSP